MFQTGFIKLSRLFSGEKRFPYVLSLDTTLPTVKAVKIFKLLSSLGYFSLQCSLGNVVFSKCEKPWTPYFQPKPLLCSISWWILTIKLLYYQITLSDYFFILFSTISCVHWMDAKDANSCTKRLSGTNWVKLAWNLKHELWNWSGVSDEGRLTCILWYFVCLVLPVTWSVHSSPLYAFSKQEPLFCCCMIVSEGNIFRFCPLWGKREEGRISPSGSFHCCRLMKTSKSEKHKRH